MNLPAVMLLTDFLVLLFLFTVSAYVIYYFLLNIDWTVDSLSSLKPLITNLEYNKLDELFLTLNCGNYGTMLFNLDLILVRVVEWLFAF